MHISRLLFFSRFFFQFQFSFFHLNPDLWMTQAEKGFSLYKMESGVLKMTTPTQNTVRSGKTIQGKATIFPGKLVSRTMTDYSNQIWTVTFAQENWQDEICLLKKKKTAIVTNKHSYNYAMTNFSEELDHLDCQKRSVIIPT